MKKIRPNLAVALIACLVISSGCVRRTATFTTLPAGARVFLNDREIGETPATVDFTWYGDYDVIYRMKGYQTVSTNVVIKPPIYQRFPFDFFAEVLWPGQLHDHHEIATQQLTPFVPPDRHELIERATAFRDQALFESDGSAQKSGR